MFYFLKPAKTLFYGANILTIINQHINTVKPGICFVKYFTNFASPIMFCSPMHCKCLLVSNNQSRLMLSRNKYDRRKKNQAKGYVEEDSDEEEEDGNESDDDEDGFDEKTFEDGSEIKTYKVKSLRIDSVLKETLRISRKKIEEFFYQNKIRVNGEILYKKSLSAKLNDEIDLIKGVDVESSDNIIVARVKILKLQADPDAERILLKALKSKSLKINNYQGKSAWRDPGAEE